MQKDWPKSVMDIYRKAVQRLDGNESPLLFGPAHVVWEDENWDFVDWCLEHFSEYPGDNTGEQLAVVRWSLEELRKIPLKDRESTSDNFRD